MNPIPLVTENVRFLNSASGRIGSAARLSTNTNSASNTTPRTANPIVWIDPQAYVVPPRLVQSTTEDSPPASSPAPR